VRSNLLMLTDCWYVIIFETANWKVPNTANTGQIRKYGQIRGHITYLILAIEKITAERNGYVNELSYVSPDSPEKENNEFEICD